jgi:hypothetical protein
VGVQGMAEPAGALAEYDEGDEDADQDIEEGEPE